MQEGDEEGGGVLGVSWQLLVSPGDWVYRSLSTQTVVDELYQPMTFSFIHFSLLSPLPIIPAFVRELSNYYANMLMSAVNVVDSNMTSYIIMYAKSDYYHLDFSLSNKVTTD